MPKTRKILQSDSTIHVLVKPLSCNSKKTPSSVHKLNSWSVGSKVPASEQGGDELPVYVPSLPCL